MAERGALPRSLGAASVVGLTLSALSPAASVYVTGSAIFRLAGTGAVAAVAIGGSAIMLASLLYAEVGAAFPAAGGLYPGIGAILGPAAARSAIAMALITSPALLAFVALGLADYAHVYAPGWPRPIVAVGMIAAACLIAAANLKRSARVALVLLAIELLALAMLVGIGVTHPARAIATVVLHPEMSTGSGGLAATPLPAMLIATISGAFACAGSSLALNFADDLDAPPERIGRLVLVTGILTVLLVGLPMLSVAIGARDMAAMLTADVPIAAFIADRTSPAFALATVAAVMLAIFNNLIAGAIAFGRFLYATGVDGIWPAAIGTRLAQLHPRRGSPAFAIGALGVVAMLATAIDQRALLALLSAEIFTALLTVLAVIVGRRRRLTGADTFRTPLYPFAPLLGIAVIVAFVAFDWQDALYARNAVLALGAIALGTFVATRRSLR